MLTSRAAAPGRTWPAFDGVRALALVGVLLAHAFPTGQVLGRAGVGLITFFTLSGFLITGLLVKERERHGDVSLRLFYARRAVRLLPALLLVLIVLNALSVTAPDAIGDPPVEQNAQASVAAFFYVGNWYDITGFPNIPRLGWLTHLWSLSVEEQFYLVWPVVLLLALRRSTRLALAITSVMIVVSPVLRLVLFDDGAGSLRILRGTDTTVDYIMWGCALALLQHRAGGPPAWLRRAGDTTALLGLALLVGVGVFLAYDLDVRAGTPWTTSLLAPGSVLLLAGIVNGGRVIPRVLALPPLQLLGRMSYGIYLWHFPIFVAVATEMPGQSNSETLPIKLAVTAAFATPAYFLIEKPLNDRFRARLQRREPPQPDAVREPALVPRSARPAPPVRRPAPAPRVPAGTAAARRPPAVRQEQRVPVAGEPDWATVRPRPARRPVRRGGTGDTRV